MNPNDLFLRPAAPPTVPQPTTSTLPNGLTANGEVSTSNGAGAGGEAMETDELVSEEKPLSKKESEQQKKDLELGELLDMMDEWKPIIPDEVTEYYLQKSGFETDDIRVKRLLALAAQRFVSSISADAFQYARTRTAAGPGGRTAAGTTGGSRAKDKTRTVLTMDDLSAALKEYGVGAERAAYYL